MNLDFEKDLLDVEDRIKNLESRDDAGTSLKQELRELKKKMGSLKKKIYKKLTPWQTVQVARHQDRPQIRDYIDAVCSEFIELHGDRNFRDDPAMIGGFATIDDERVMLIGMSKGKSVDDKVKTNFGMPNPEGYRKALRLMKLAERYRTPILCLVDTPAAYPGKEAEERGQAEAIARNLTEMAGIEVPIVVVITGEGGSGGALGIAVGDAILMLSNSVYSVIPPEGCAAILWRDAAKAPDAAGALKVTADSLLSMGIIDEIIPEPAGGAHRDYDKTFNDAKKVILKHLTSLKKISARKLVDRRYDKFTKIGRFKKTK